MPGIKERLTKEAIIITSISLSQISFLVPKEAIPGRLGMLLTLFLCMINTLNAVAKTSPKSGGSSSALIDWIVSCLVFILMAILEYAWILSHDKPLEVHQTSLETNLKDIKKQHTDPKEMCKVVDKIMQIIFLPMFAAFAGVFWAMKVYH